MVVSKHYLSILATTAIAATLLSNGRTVHSTFKVPINVEETSMLQVKTQSDVAELLQKTELIVIDEVSKMKTFKFLRI